MTRYQITVHLGSACTNCSAPYTGGLNQTDPKHSYAHYKHHSQLRVCQKIYSSLVTDQIQRMCDWSSENAEIHLKAHPRDKRSPLLIPMIAGYFAGNALRTITNAILQDPTEDAIKSQMITLSRKLDNLNSRSAVQTQINQAVGKSLGALERSMKDIRRGVQLLESNYGDHFLLFSHVVARLHQVNSNLQWIHASFMREEVDLEALSEILDTTWLNNLDPKSAIPISFELLQQCSDVADRCRSPQVSPQLWNKQNVFQDEFSL